MEFILKRLHHIFTLPLTEEVVVFALMLGIILIVPIVMKRLHLPQVIGLILCGVLVGPHALNIIDNSGSVSLFSTIGVLYIMFIAGLELDLAQFKANQNRSLLFGLFTYLGPLVVAFPILFYGYDLTFLQSFLIATMFATHTLIAYPLVSSYGVAKDPAVAITVGGTILVDTLALIILAVILGLNSGNLSASFWIQLVGSLLAFTAIMFFVIPRIGEWFFKSWHNERYLRYIFIIFMVFVSSVLAEMAGLEAIIGAFFAGLVLNRLIPHASVLMQHIEFVGNALFIPFFLVTVGMLVNVQVLLEGTDTIILALVISALALGGKWLSAFVSQKLFKYTKAQRDIIFGLSSARVAATLAIALVAHRAGLMNDTFLNATIILILITSIVGSLVTERAAKNLAQERQTAAPAEQLKGLTTNEHILLPIANINNSADLLNFALILKSPLSTYPLIVLSVVADNTKAESSIRAFRTELEPHVNEALQANVRVEIMSAIDHSVPNGIARVAREHLTNLLIIGWPKPGFAERIIGEKWSGVVSSIDKTIICCSLEAPTTSMKRLVLFTLPFAEHEVGFEAWLDKVIQTATQWSLDITHYGTTSTYDAIQAVITSKQLTAVISPNPVDHWVDILERASSLLPSDLIVFVSARRNTLSYQAFCENIPERLSKACPLANKLLIFPAQPQVDPETISVELEALPADYMPV